MKTIKSDIAHFFQKQNFTVVSTVDRNGRPHSSCKGLVKINRNGRIYLIDLYKTATFTNLRKNPRISLTEVDEHKFKGYCLKGKAKIAEKDVLKPNIIKAWERRVTGRITQRVLKNMLGEKGHAHHPEALLPEPAYLILMETEEIVDLTPHHIKKGGKVR